jgi:hypothetical protein
VDSSTKLLSIVTVSAFDMKRLKITLESLLPQDRRIEHVLVIPQEDKLTLDFLSTFSKEHSADLQIIFDDSNGIYPAMENGAKASCGKFFTFWNSGDHLGSRPQMELLLDALENEEAKWVLTGGLFSWVDYPVPNVNLLRNFLLQSPGGYISHQCVLFSKSAFFNQPFFNFKYQVAADTDQIFRLSKLSTPRFLPFSAVRVEKGNYSATRHRRARLELFSITALNLRGFDKIFALCNLIRQNMTFLLQKFTNNS